MAGEHGYDELLAAVRQLQGPGARLMGAPLRVLAGRLADGERLEALFVASAPGRFLDPGDLVAATDRGLHVLGRNGRPVRQVAWAEVTAVDVEGRRPIVRTTTGDLRVGRPVVAWDVRVVAERARGGAGRAVAARAALDAAFGRSAWTRLDVLDRVVGELGRDEQVRRLIEPALPPGLAVLTDRRVGLVPPWRRRAARWVDLVDVRAVRLDGEDLHVLGDPDAELHLRGLAPREQVEGFAESVAIGAGVPLNDGGPWLDEGEPWFDEGEPWLSDGDCYIGDGDWYLDDTTAGSWPAPPDDAVARRLAAFATDLAARLDGVAEVAPGHPGRVTVRPASPAAAALSWDDSGHGLQLEIDWGRVGVVRFDRGEPDRLEAAVRAVLCGRIGVRRGGGVLRLHDGTELRAARPPGQVALLGAPPPAYVACAWDAERRLHD